MFQGSVFQPVNMLYPFLIEKVTTDPVECIRGIGNNAPFIQDLTHAADVALLWVIRINRKK